MIDIKKFPIEIQKEIWRYVFNFCIEQIRILFHKIPEFSINPSISNGKIIILKIHTCWKKLYNLNKRESDIKI